MRTSQALDAIAPALAKAQASIQPAMKDRTNPAFKSRYADLTAVWEACRKAINDNGLSALQEVIAAEDGIAVTTRFLHSSGQWIEFGPTPIPVNKKDAQGTGSAISYGKRYALSAAIGVVADDDDDGNAAARGKPEDRKSPWTAELTGAARLAASGGIQKYQAWWKSLSDASRSVLVQTKEHAEYKKAAAVADDDASNAAIAEREAA